MPRDDWAKARAKDAARKGRQGVSTRKRKNVKRSQSLRQTQVMRDRLESWDARMWFGKFNGRKLRDCQRWYLDFLTTLEPTSERIRMIVSFLRSELKTR